MRARVSAHMRALTHARVRACHSDTLAVVAAPSPASQVGYGQTVPSTDASRIWFIVYMVVGQHRAAAGEGGRQEGAPGCDLEQMKRDLRIKGLQNKTKHRKNSIFFLLGDATDYRNMKATMLSSRGRRTLV